VDLPPQTSTSGPYRPASRRDALAITSLLYIRCTVITNRCLTPFRAFWAAMAVREWEMLGAYATGSGLYQR